MIGGGCWGYFVEKDYDGKTNFKVEILDVCVCGWKWGVSSRYIVIVMVLYSGIGWLSISLKLFC